MSSGIISPSSHRCLCSIRHYSTSIWSLLTWINSIITISIRLSTRIHLDCLYHARISLILTLLSCSTSIEPWDESTLAPSTTNCLTWAPAYRSAPSPPYYLQRTIPFPHTSLYSMVVFHLSILSKLKYLPSLLSIVLSLRKVPCGLVYKAAHVFPLSLASSAHHLHSNLVSFP